MAITRLSVLCVALFACLVLADYPYPQDLTDIKFTQTYSNGTIYYQSEDSLFTFVNVANPITLKISYSSGYNYPASVCLNSDATMLPIAGKFLETTCPAGGFGTLSNKEMTDGSDFDDTPHGASKDTLTAQVFVKPSSNAGFVVTIPDAEDDQTFQITWEGSQCMNPNYYPVGSNKQCIEIDDLQTTQVVSIGAGTWKYFKIDLPAFSSTNTNNFTVTVNGTDNGISMYLQEGYIPTSEWFLVPDIDDSVDDQISATILTPGTLNNGETYFLGVFNSNEGTSQVAINTKNGVCPTTSEFGYNCDSLSTNSTSPSSGFMTLSASLQNGASAANNGSTISFDFSDSDTYDHRYAYFKLTDYPDYPRPYNVRVTVGNNVISDLQGAPAIFAKLGGWPSAQSNHYNQSRTGDVSHQLSLPITEQTYNGGVTSDEYTWFIAVKLPVDFAIWVGTNCADGCDDNKHGKCMCGTSACADITSNYTQNIASSYYTLPTSLTDSSGACTCDNEKFAQSYDCSEKNNGYTPLYLLILFILGIIVLLIAIAVPVYCWFVNKKKKAVPIYDEM